MNFLSSIYRRIPSFKGKKRLGKILFRAQIFHKKNRVITCRNNLKFHLLNTQDSVGRDLFFDGVYEPKTLHTIEKALADGDIMIDAGANIGAICLPVARKKNVHVFAFEPAPGIFSVLKENKEINDLQNVNILPLGLSDKEGSIDFYESDRMHGWSGMVKIDSFRHCKVAITTLDKFAENNHIENITVLKADVQGWEYFVFKGAERLLNEKRIATIIFEFEWWAEKNAGLDAGSAQRFLMEKGYKLSTLDGAAVRQPFTEGSVILQARLV